MRSIRVFFLFLAVAAMSCNKVSPVPLTTDEQLQYDINLIDQYLADNHIDAIKLESGVRYIITQQGDGPAPTKDNCIRFRYSGYGLLESTPFDSNTTDYGYKVSLKGLVVGMQIGLKQMSIGTKGVIYIPSGLAYGSQGRGYDGETQLWDIDPNESIRFEVELVQLYDYNEAGNYCYE